MLQHFQRSKPLTRLGVVVSDLRPSILNDSLIKLGNKIVNERSDFDFYVFNEDWKPSSTSLCFPLVQQRNAWGFNGKLIATNIATAKKIINLPDISEKYLYVWNIIEWINAYNNASEILEIYCHPKLKLLTRSEEYAFILQNNFNKEVQILRDFDYDSTIKLFRSV